MSVLCLYSCGNYTDEPDGVCTKCKGYSRAKEIIKNIKTEGDEEMGTSTGKKCKKDGCEKGAWKGGMCFRDFFKEHPEEKRPTAKTAKKINDVGAGFKPAPTKPPTLPLASPDINELVARMKAKRDSLKYEIIKIDGALLTLKDMCGIEAPEPEFLVER